MDIRDDERFRVLAELMRNQQDPDKLVTLAEELCRLLDDQPKKRKPQSD